MEIKSIENAKTSGGNQDDRQRLYFLQNSRW